METIVIFLLIFAPFAWGVRRLLRHTRDTIGANSPLKVKRIYQIKPWAYFSTFDNFLMCMFGGMGLLFLKVAFFVRFVLESGDIIGKFIVLAFGMMFFSFPLIIILVDINHWKYVDGVSIETFPKEHELEMTFGETKLRLRHGDIVKVLVTGRQGKMPITYKTYYLANGDHFILPDKMPGAWVIEEYFKKIPSEFKHKVFPFIR
ncbi:hypothetical protein [Dyadobacter fermentans]|uniref:PH domain-containing protein n=1 Tax=Dyadobacter fermentans (strain ATCC 700827 / DSM 18053 / CIP 107007 / KCTC 52180 / NS114) TaxID=471854 RepID=C6VU45_DYAFD|nr:hypothetical protein [Dyadobacter fermentans]ACT94813.1 hypothetical protein Dfer_3606 [Dyadobacter fermentans DSM 18053]